MQLIPNSPLALLIPSILTKEKMKEFNRGSMKNFLMEI